MNIARAPDDALYQATWNQGPLPASRHQSFDAPGRPKGQKLYQQTMDDMVGKWPDEDRRWTALRDYYYNAIRDCDQKVQTLPYLFHLLQLSCPNAAKAKKKKGKRKKI
jgi:arylsulfatase A-like enzyme